MCVCVCVSVCVLECPKGKKHALVRRYTLRTAPVSDLPASPPPHRLPNPTQVSASQGLMLESTCLDLLQPGAAHHGCSSKHPTARLATIEAAGRAGVPYTSGTCTYRCWVIAHTRVPCIDTRTHTHNLREFPFVRSLACVKCVRPPAPICHRRHRPPSPVFLRVLHTHTHTYTHTHTAQGCWWALATAVPTAFTRWRVCSGCIASTATYRCVCE